MKDLLVILARNLVDKPDEVVVTESLLDGATVLKLTVAPDDMGKVIGKQGRIARAIRTVVKAAAVHANVKVIVEII
ncbi:MAG: KH domain-containing protein [Defluviitaleaceae bacterium]|nr:KH domain-containing protein [Defluviitaleaceae bacterium]